ncbi:Phosphate transport system permease protein PstC 1 [Gammaproteobacteria bacterium]|nr:MAG: phosphate ABC transporter permease subunit PstC [Gammaproteobacteria bacterium]CAG0938585.1 Phosphate transport system permease protein PstC 1 [Gammaproteobacteria bacterium]
MRLPTLLLLLSALLFATFVLARRRAITLVGGHRGIRNLHSLPVHYGCFAAVWAAGPALLLLLLWVAGSDSFIMARVVEALPEPYRSADGPELGLVMNDVRTLAAGRGMGTVRQLALQPSADLYLSLQTRARWLLALLVISVAMAGGLLAGLRISPRFRARNHVEALARMLLMAASMVAIVTTVGILLSVVFEAARFFARVPVHEFLFGLEWSPQTAIRPDQVGASGAFGAVPLFAGTLLITAIAMLVAVPAGLMSAIYLSEYAAPRVRSVVKPVLEILAGIPTVVYGYFAAITVAPLLREAGQAMGMDVESESALGAGLVMGVMIIPFVSSLSDDVINAVPQSLRDGSLALGATVSETIRRVVVPAALPGIVGGVLLGVSRAIGETMIVVMAAGLSAKLTANPLEAVTTVTVQIVTLLVGDQEFDSPKTLAAFALGLVLFIVTLSLNIVALRVVRRYREQYE